MQTHLDTENYLEQCRQKRDGFAYTIVREGLYSESFPLEELGEGTAELIAQFYKQPAEFKWKNKTALLSGLKALTLAETVKILGEIARVPVRITQVSDDEFATQPDVIRNFTYHGVDLAKRWATAFKAFRRGEAAYVCPLLKELLGRDPEDFKTTIGGLV
ncbi:hypothetical protein FAUST_11789 [Fusarium austroamericanum]|uniref:NmrA-like domain-containing protein n=1 Tax=Fusarium austroamericanum TaxID=282268 RepID=A0AAN5YYY7_FUSAU|nr:hypothetical protein FAUST_11789 [Fusarium austroamericanum]